MKKIRVYPHPAGGWPALGNSALSLIKQGTLLKGGASMLHANQPDGFDCPGCAWPDSSSHKAIDFCENGVKAVANEATSQRVTADFFAQHTVAELRSWSDYELERAGRLTEPMRYDAVTDRYVPISWAQAFAEIGGQLRDLRESAGADAAAFYTSGRTSNEAAFLYQLFVRAFGTNNMPDCSNMCHEATSVGLKQQIGIGKGTITLDDFDHAQAIFIFGQNPATNHPRMMGTLHEAVKRGCPILAFNPLREAGLEAFTNPQSPLEMLTGKGLPIAMRLYQVNIGGDAALLTGIIKAVLTRDGARDAEQGGVLDREFIATQTSGFSEFAAHIAAQSWADIETASGISKAELEEIAEIYCASQATICTWGMGITQHQRGIDNVQMIVNLLLLRGNIGKTGAGAAPIRGHSNVQGDRTMGIYEKPDAALLDRLEQVFQLPMPRKHGVDVVDTLKGLADGSIQAFIALGGNFAAATPDTQNTYAALQNAKLTVQISTKLNRSHVVHGQSAYILPCLGRTEADWQEGGWQSVTTEDSMSRVMLSRGRNRPASEQLWSEPAIVAGLAQASLASQPVDWAYLVADYDRIRELIAQTIAGFEDFNQRVRAERGFYLGNSAREHVWKTSTAKAQFIAPSQPIHTPIAEGLWMLTTIRSHDQYNTTIYALDDRYRNIHGERRVCFMHPDEISRMGWQVDQSVDLTSVFGDAERTVTGFKLKPFDLPAGCIASYYPETNDLIPLDHHTPRAQTPAYKSIPVRLSLSNEVSP